LRLQSTARSFPLSRSIEVEDAAAAAVRFESGAIASILCSALSPRQQSYLRLDFERASVELDHFTTFNKANWRITPAPGCDDVLQHWEAAASDDPPQQGTQLASIFDAMQAEAGSDATDDPALVTGPQLRRTLELVTGILKSNATAAPVTAGSVLPGDPFYHHLAGPRALR
ncbi:MAG: gfo/Idh/MocA family oxidoreductase, partial [Planctomycetota bacterium]